MSATRLLRGALRPRQFKRFGSLGATATPQAVCACRRAASSSSSSSPAASSSRPGGTRDAYYEVRDLPPIPSRSSAPLLVLLGLLAGGSWAGFLYYATNSERANSSVVKSLLFQLKTADVVREWLGTGARLDPWVLNFTPIKGSINVMAGSIDLSFRVAGTKDKATAMFTSVRQGKEARFQIIRWKLIRDDGEVLDLLALAGDPRSESHAL